MARLPFDDERDCTRADTYQDVRLTSVDGRVCIEQPDGAGEDYHFIVIPEHMVARFADAYSAVLAGAEPITLSGQLTTEE